MAGAAVRSETWLRVLIVSQHGRQEHSVQGAAQRKWRRELRGVAVFGDGDGRDVWAGERIVVCPLALLTLRDRFLGAELVFEAWSPLHVWVSNLQLSTSFVPHLHWGIWRGQEIERWGDGIRLLDEWGFFDRPEPRLAHIRWTRHIESMARTMRIYHFQLGKATE